MYGIKDVPRSIGIIQPIKLLIAMVGSRLVIKYILTYNYDFKKLNNKKNVLIFGTGESGRQLVTALENNPEFKVIGFLEDSGHLNGQVLLGKMVYNSSELEI